MATVQPEGSLCVPSSADPGQRAEIMEAHVRDALSSPAVRAAADGCRGAIGVASQRDIATRVLRRVQAAGYRDDPPGCDRYAPVEFTLRNGGDCDDLAPAVAALAILCGLQARFVYLSQPRSPLDHVTVKVLVDGEWLWAEPTLRGARLGEHPYDAARRIGDARPLFGGGTAGVSGVVDGVIANVLTIGLIAGAAWLGARIVSGGGAARDNPGPPVETWREETFRLDYTHGIVWIDPREDGEFFRLEQLGDHTSVTWGRADKYGSAYAQRDVQWKGAPTEPIPADALREMGPAVGLIAYELQQRFGELRDGDFTER